MLCLHVLVSSCVVRVLQLFTSFAARVIFKSASMTVALLSLHWQLSSASAT